MRILSAATNQKNMKAVICPKYGSPEVLQIQEITKPTPKDNQILVKIMASAVNSGDVRVRSLNVEGILKLIMRMVLGFWKPRKPVLGTVFSGVITETGKNVSKFRVGEKVFGMTGFDFGTHTEFIAVHQNSNVMPMPENASFEEAAAIIFGGQTALYYLKKANISERYQPKVLIIGATGAVGIAAVQIAKSFQAKVTTVSSSSGAQLIQTIGVEKMIFYDKEDFTKQLATFDIIFDAVGKSSKTQCKKLLRKNGAYISVTIGYASESLSQLQFLKTLFEKGNYHAAIDKIYSMEEIIEAHRYVESGRKKGNVVLKICDSSEKQAESTTGK